MLQNDLREVGRAAGQIKDASARFEGGKPNRGSLPAAIHPVGKDARNEVVPGCDHPEHTPHQATISFLSRNRQENREYSKRSRLFAAPAYAFFEDLAFATRGISISGATAATCIGIWMELSTIWAMAYAGRSSAS